MEPKVGLMRGVTLREVRCMQDMEKGKDEMISDNWILCRESF